MANPPNKKKKIVHTAKKGSIIDRLRFMQKDKVPDKTTQKQSDPRVHHVPSNTDMP